MRTKARVTTVVVALLLSLHAYAQTKLTKQDYREMAIAGSRSSEAKSNLKALFTGEKAYFSEKDKFGATMTEAGFAPERGNRYSYFLAPAGPAEQRKTGVDKPANAVIIGPDEDKNPDQRFAPTLRATGCPVTLPKGMTEIGVGKGEAAFVRGAKPEPAIVAVAAATLTSGPEYDCWSISNIDRTTKGGMGGALVGQLIKAGEPYHEKAGYPEKLGEQLWQTTQSVAKIAEEAFNQWKPSKVFPDSLAALVKSAGKGDPAPKDAWGRPITYRKTSLGVTISSPGPDGKDGDDDDVQITIGNDGKPSLD